jgi:putative ABC transport system substrate-binding protein
MTRARTAVAMVAILFAAACGGRADSDATAGRASSGQPRYRIGLLYFAPEEGADSVFKGLFEALGESGIREGENLEVKRVHAQGEIANIPMLVQDLDNSGLDLIVAMTTPCLTAACSMARNTPVVFTYVYDPVAAGAGKSATDHLPNVTGVGSFPPVADTVDVLHRLAPGAKKIGTVYNSSEANSTKVVSVARPLFQARGLALEEATVTGTADLYQAAQALVARGVEALWITGDNTALQGFDALVKVARDAHLPLVINDPEFVPRGALAAVGLGWQEAGRAAAPVIVRVLRGESPAAIPFQEVAVKKIVLNDEVARALGITFPQDLVREAAANAIAASTTVAAPTAAAATAAAVP